MRAFKTSTRSKYCPASSLELGARGITVNAISPCPTETDMMQNRYRHKAADMSPFHRVGDGTLPGEVIRPALQNHKAKDMGNGFFLFETIDIGAESYKTVWFAETQIEDGGGVEGFIGLSFMARHVVTFDFPKGVLYLRSISAQARR